MILGVLLGNSIVNELKITRRGKLSNFLDFNKVSSAGHPDLISNN